ncbi:peptidase M28 [Dendrothele bispora CBS 962.96]|uniref:Peptide hydrolase n=1 Tax=Dendrothele bispora (strain CBS 962.96) TaxID=1314807 RepID=A0A4S8M1U4_DENBC|nr:peptidase M28 [Dendrothele bispora CBS 962.96]
MHAVLQTGFISLSLALLLSTVQAQPGPLQFTYDLNWPPGPGSSLSPQQPSPELTQALNQISPSNIEQTIRTLVSFGTRHTLSSQDDPKRGIGAARDWIKGEFQKYADEANRRNGVVNGKNKMDVEIQSYVQGPADRIPNDTVISNVLATLHGTESSSRTWVISGHYDSRVTDVMNFIDDAPGADDDASGVAISLELARVFSLAPTPPKATIIFAAVAGEEQGLYGSTHLANTLKNASVDVQGMLDNDIVGASRGGGEIGDGDRGEKVDPWNIRMFAQGIPPPELGNETAVTARTDIGAENDSPARQLGRFGVEVASNAVTNMSVQMIYRPDRFLRGGDHLPFLDAGYPAVRFTEPNEDFAHQHQDVRVDNVTGQQFGDLPEFCDFEFISRVAKVNGAILWSGATAPGMPQNVKIIASQLTNNSTFTWDIDQSVQGYEVVWRPTELPFWTKVIDVGKVGTATVLLSKDNVQFGVRAVGEDGLKSAAVAPFP